MTFIMLDDFSFSESPRALPTHFTGTIDIHSSTQGTKTLLKLANLRIIKIVIIAAVGHQKTEMRI